MSPSRTNLCNGTFDGHLTLIESNSYFDFVLHYFYIICFYSRETIMYFFLKCLLSYLLMFSWSAIGSRSKSTAFVQLKGRAMLLINTKRFLTSHLNIYFHIIKYFVPLMNFFNTIFDLIILFIQKIVRSGRFCRINTFLLISWPLIIANILSLFKIMNKFICKKCFFLSIYFLLCFNCWFWVTVKCRNKTSSLP